MNIIQHEHMLTKKLNLDHVLTTKLETVRFIQTLNHWQLKYLMVELHENLLSNVLLHCETAFKSMQ